MKVGLSSPCHPERSELASAVEGSHVPVQGCVRSLLRRDDINVDDDIDVDKDSSSPMAEPTATRVAAECDQEGEARHCCEMMRSNVEQQCDQHPDPFDCADRVVYFAENLREYGLIIHDGGSSHIAIAYCPWCATKLPKSRRDELYSDGLYANKLEHGDPMNLGERA
jgi:hypothetical protein